VTSTAPFPTPGERAIRNLKPRKEPSYDSAIHGRHDYDSALFDEEPEEDIAARTRILDTIAKSPPDVKASFLLVLSRWPANTASLGRPHSAPRVRTIWHHGGQTYSTCGDPVAVTEEEHRVLEAFAKRQQPMTRAEIESADLTANAARVMSRLAEAYSGQFKLAIRRPGKKGNGGYYARVRPIAEMEQ
jgi:hypothetical protein